MLKWAAELEPRRIAERKAVVEVAEWRLDQVPEPWRTAWRVVAEAHRIPEVEEGRRHDYRLGQRIRSGERSTGLIADIAAVVSPRLKVEWRGAWPAARMPKRPRKVGDLLHRRLISGRVAIGDDLSLDGVGETAFLTELAEALEAEIVRGLHLGREIGWHAGRSVAWLGGLDRVQLRRGDGSSEPDRFHRGIAPAVHLLIYTVGRLAALDAALARPFLQRWLTRRDDVHHRMWAAAAVDAALAAADEASEFLLRLPVEQVWHSSRFPEFAELRAIRFSDFGPVAQRAIVDTLMRGPPRAYFGRHWPIEERRRWRTGLIVRELTRIEAAGTSLPSRAVRWLGRHRSAFEDFASPSTDAAFPTGVSARWVPPEPDADLDDLSGEDLATMIDTRLRSEGSSSGVWDWLADGERSFRLAQALLSTSRSSDRFGLAWNALGQRVGVPRIEEEGGAKLAALLPIVRSVLHAILAMSDVVLREAAPGLSQWLERWAPHLRGDGQLLVAISKLWTFAAMASRETTDANDYEEAEQAEAKRVAHDSFDSPIGHLTGAFLEACPKLSEVPRPFEADAGLRAVRDLIGETPGRAGTIARYRCATGLPYFMRADPDWAEAVLISRLEDGEDSDVFWHAVAHSRPARNAMARLGRLMARRVISGNLGTEVRKALVERVCLAMLNDMLDGEHDAEWSPDATQMLRAVSDGCRAHAAHAVHRFAEYFKKDAEAGQPSRENAFDRAVGPFMEKVWPQERTAVTPAVAEALASIPSLSGRRFTQAVSVLRRFLMPFEAWSMHNWGLDDNSRRSVPDGIIVNADEAAAALELLDLTIGHDPNVRVPVGLDVVLGHLVEHSAKLRRDRRFARLEALTRG